MTLSESEISTVVLRLEEIYALADKNLNETKSRMIIDDIKDLSLDYILSKIKAIKLSIISGNKFETAAIYRFMGIKEKQEFTKPLGCEKCEDGYIGYIETYKGICDSFYGACDCELGRYRQRVEKLLKYNGQELTDIYKIKHNELLVSKKEIENAKEYLNELL